MSFFPPPACIQESISDFYWYYSGKDIIDEPGKRNFSKAMTVAKQVFNSLTEYIQVRELFVWMMNRERVDSWCKAGFQGDSTGPAGAGVQFLVLTLQLSHQQKRKGNKIKEFQLIITLKPTFRVTF